MAEADEIEATRIEVPHYPWHRQAWARLTAPGALARLPHALLLHGPPGLGKLAFALRLCRVLLCQQPVATDPDEGLAACGQCKSCLLFTAGTHPDWLRLSPAEQGRPITVDQVRAVIEFLALRPHTAGRQVVLLVPAEAMNVNAANSLLKVLEEPTAESYFVLVAHQPARLLVTVRSRCQGVPFKLPAPAEALDWLTKESGAPQAQAAELLALAGGSPLTALHYFREGWQAQREALLADLQALAQGRVDPVACAGRWAERDIMQVLDWLYLAVAGRIEHAVVSNQPTDPDRRIKTYNINGLLCFLDVISRTKSGFPGPLDGRLALENLFIEWCRLHGAGSKISLSP